jgi:hypothetical protein
MPCRSSVDARLGQILSAGYLSPDRLDESFPKRTFREENSYFSTANP